MKVQLCTATLNHYAESASASDNKLLFLARDINDSSIFNSDRYILIKSSVTEYRQIKWMSV